MIADGLAVFSELQAGRIDVGLLSAAQVDPRGNLNSTVIGSYNSPKLVWSVQEAHMISLALPTVL